MTQRARLVVIGAFVVGYLALVGFALLQGQVAAAISAMGPILTGIVTFVVTTELVRNERSKKNNED